MRLICDQLAMTFVWGKYEYFNWLLNVDDSCLENDC